MRITFTGGTLVAGIAALTMIVISARSANSESKDDPITWITQYENDAAAADLAGDVFFYQKNRGYSMRGSSRGCTSCAKATISASIRSVCLYGRPCAAFS